MKRPRCFRSYTKDLLLAEEEEGSYDYAHFGRNRLHSRCDVIAFFQGPTASQRSEGVVNVAARPHRPSLEPRPEVESGHQTTQPTGFRED